MFSEIDQATKTMINEHIIKDTTFSEMEQYVKYFMSINPDRRDVTII
jgi:hypothetical protein